MYVLSQADSIEREDWEMLREERWKKGDFGFYFLGFGAKWKGEEGDWLGMDEKGLDEAFDDGGKRWMIDWIWEKSSCPPRDSGSGMGGGRGRRIIQNL
jgi:hypothetical protein